MSFTWRQIKFNLIEWFVIPAGVAFLKALSRTWRIDKESLVEMEDMLETERLVVATFHGMFFPLLAFGRIARRRGKEACTMTSPSRDGRLLDKAIEAFDMKVVKGSSKSKSVAGSRALIHEIENGIVGVLAVDGPRGPVTVPKAGFIRITQHTKARLMIVVGGASRYIQFGSWDLPFLPLPFSRVYLEFREFVLPEDSPDREEETVDALHKAMLDAGRACNCPIISRAEEKGKLK